MTLRGVWLAGIALVAAAAQPAWGQSGGQPSSEAPPPDRLAPSQLLNGPSLNETGRIAGMGATALPAADGKPVAPAAAVGDSREKSVEPLAARAEMAPRERAGVIDARTLEAEIRDRFAALDDCRIEVARRQRVAPAAVQADTLTLRWIIRPNGEAKTTQVVAITPTDLDLMDCVKATMSTWTFTRPRGGPVAVERAFKFRAAP
jgi:hypothetical protein